MNAIVRLLIVPIVAVAVIGGIYLLATNVTPPDNQHTEEVK